MNTNLSHQIASATGLLLFFAATLSFAEWLRYPEDNALSSLAASVAQFIGLV